MAAALSLALLPLACAESPSSPPAPSPVPPSGFAGLLPRLDLAQPGLAPVAARLAAHDSLGAAQALLDYYLARPELSCPHASYGDPEAIADSLLAGRLMLIPHPTVALPEDPNWAEDPLGDANWRFQYHSFRWAMALFQTYEATGRSDCLDRFRFLLADYARDNLVATPPSTMTWYDMAAAFRAENWLYQWQRGLQLGIVELEPMIDVLGWIAVHGEALATTVPYAASSNHGVFHNRALIALGLILPEFRASADWLALGSTRLTDQLLALVDEDGVYREGAPFYHYYMLTTFRSATDLFAAAALPLPAAAESRLAAMPRFATHYLKPTGELPMIGDTPRTMPLSTYHHITPELDYALGGGEYGQAPTETMVHFPQGGYACFRSGWGGSRAYRDETQIVFDFSPLGGWHGQYDGLNVELTSWGENLVVDPGQTGNDDPWRSWFKSPAAHNVLVLADGAAPTRPDPQGLVWRHGEDWAFCSAWVPISDQRDWVRRLVFLAPDELLLIDDSYGSRAEAVDFLLHFAPTATLNLGDAGGELQNGDARLDIRFATPVDLSAHTGESDPPQGWYAEGYGALEAAPSLRARRQGQAVGFRTLLHAHGGADPLLDFTALEEQGNHLRFSIQRRSGSEVVEVWPEIGLVVRTPAAGTQAISSP